MYEIYPFFRSSLFIYCSLVILSVFSVCLLEREGKEEKRREEKKRVLGMMDEFEFGLMRRVREGG